MGLWMDAPEKRSPPIEGYDNTKPLHHKHETQPCTENAKRWELLLNRLLYHLPTMIIRLFLKFLQVHLVNYRHPLNLQLQDPDTYKRTLLNAPCSQS